MIVISAIKKRFKRLLNQFKRISAQDERKLIEIDRDFPKVLSTRDTLALIVNQKASICRYGDAEFDISLQKNKNDPYQRPSEALSLRLNEILQHGSEDGLVVAIPPFNSQFNNDKNYFGKLSFWEWYWLTRFDELKMLFVKPPFGNSFVSRDCVFYENSLADVLKIWENRDVVFVLGKGGRFHFDPRLFSCLKSSQFVYVPPTSAFDDYERILNESMQYPKSSLFLIAAGPTATVLAFDLHKQGYQAIDMGHISICYQQFLGEVHSPESLPLITS